MNKVWAEFVQKLKTQVKLVEIVSDHVVLRQVGNHWVGLCPFHNERTPSFSVSDKKQLYHCYGCKAGGDVFRFMMDLHGMSFIEAVRECAARLNIPLPNQGQAAEEKGSEIERKLRTAFKLNRFVANFFRKNLAEDLEAISYLNSRKVRKDCLDSFFVGSNGTHWSSLFQHLRSAKAPLELAEELGLIRRSQNQASQDPYFDLFRSRILFPVLDSRGRIQGFGGRVYGEGQKDQPKYLNSPDSFVFHKSEVFFGIHAANKFIRERDCAIVVEGYFDCISLFQNGFEHSVATCGTALSARHLDYLERSASKILVLFDGDQAGQAAMDKAMELGLSKGILIHGVVLPSQLDPDEFLEEQGPAALQNLVASSEPWLDMRIQALLSQGQKLEEKQKALQTIGKWLRDLNDPVARALRIDVLQNQYQVSGVVLNSLKLPTGKASVEVRAPRKKPLPQKANAQAAPHWETALFLDILKNCQKVEFFEKLGPLLPPGAELWDLFTNASLKQCLKEILANWDGGSNEKTLSDYAEKCQDPEMRSLILGYLVTGSDSENPLSAGQEAGALGKAVSTLWARFSHDIRERMAEAERKSDSEIHQKLMQEYLDVQRKIKECQGLYDHF